MIKFVPLEKVSEIIQNFKINKPTEKGMFLTVKGNQYIALDNSIDYIITKKFTNMEDAINWLKYKLPGTFAKGKILNV